MFKLNSKRISFAALIFVSALSAKEKRLEITEFGAVGDGVTMNTTSIQSLIDDLAAEEGGTIIVPEGIFMSGALDFRPGVDLYLDEGAVLKASTDMQHFPERRTRIEGHFEESFNPALINADGCDGFSITGTGTIDGNGRAVWDIFWARFNASEDKKGFKNLSVPRARLAIIENSRDVLVEGVTFKDSQYWNLHLYNCQDVLIKDARFVVPDDYRQAPSSDGVDVDSCQDVEIVGCYFSVTDDCVAMKGSKGPYALGDEASPAVERVTIRDCNFRRGHGAVVFGSEATVVRDVRVENCEVNGAMPLVRLKLRPDTPQLYENVVFDSIRMNSDGAEIFEIKKWTQYFDLKGEGEPISYVGNIEVSNVTGSIENLGIIEGNTMTRFGPISLSQVDVEAKKDFFKVSDRVLSLELQDVVVNGVEIGVL
ncbi:glycoside hydrolase family 28 protein [Pelagicoccus albus]|uniref:Exopolygalacturonase n=1 Tax=Pelagicoccus albus TaxID=415222 RepID=A0A7X1B819_9BACT|nr:glycosyl hydrolase family 28 protein [Pelagicoccus albus]MBC2606118.1 exopolygalacturonase [Pelagicoccus albus]